ncbi:dual specificity protein phosphatase 3-like [Amphiura filiformis]|uniref:dual specificity protein phosphatase 3-like n=1 Tax=Amphiura filiformis TaxID=82378 RepID=UPI003B20B827
MAFEFYDASLYLDSYISGKKVSGQNLIVPEVQRQLQDLTTFFDSRDQLCYSDNCRPDEIITNLFISGYNSAIQFEQLKEQGFTHVLNVNSRVSLEHIDAYESRGIKFTHVPMEDDLGYDMRRNFNAAIAFIRMAIIDGGRILVHCQVGKSRSSTVIAAYLIVFRDYSASTALKEMVFKRPMISPNRRFLQFLCELEVKVKESKRTDAPPGKPNLVVEDKSMPNLKI